MKFKVFALLREQSLWGKTFTGYTALSPLYPFLGLEVWERSLLSNWFLFYWLHVEKVHFHRFSSDGSEEGVPKSLGRQKLHRGLLWIKICNHWKWLNSFPVLFLSLISLLKKKKHRRKRHAICAGRDEQEGLSWRCRKFRGPCFRTSNKKTK